MGYTKVQRQKEEFAAKELCALLKKVDPDIVGAGYKATDEGEEVVTVYYKRDGHIEVRTCGSFGAMTIDVLQAIA